MKNYTELCKEQPASPVPVLTGEQQQALSHGQERGNNATPVESSIDGTVVTSRLEAAYAAMTPEQIKALHWTDKIRTAQGKSLGAKSPVAEAATITKPVKRTDWTDKCRQARQPEKKVK